MASDPISLNGNSRRGPEAVYDKYYLFDGEFSVRERFFHPLVKCSTVELRHYIDELLDTDEAYQEINAGVFVVGRIDKRPLELLIDPLGQYPLYYFRSGERFIVSNVLRQIVALLVASGLKATPNLVPCLEGIVLGGILSDSTHITEIRRVPYGCAVVVDTHLCFKKCCPKLRSRKGNFRDVSLSVNPIRGACPSLHFKRTCCGLAVCSAFDPKMGAVGNPLVEITSEFFSPWAGYLGAKICETTGSVGNFGAFLAVGKKMVEHSTEPMQFVTGGLSCFE